MAKHSTGAASGLKQAVGRFARRLSHKAGDTNGNASEIIPVEWLERNRLLIISGALLFAGFILWLPMFPDGVPVIRDLPVLSQKLPLILFILLGLFLFASDVDKRKRVSGKITVRECAFAATFPLFHYINAACFYHIDGPARYILIAASAAAIFIMTDFKVHVLLSCIADLGFFIMVFYTSSPPSFGILYMWVLRWFEALWLVLAMGHLITDILGYARRGKASLARKGLMAVLIAGTVIYAVNTGLMESIPYDFLSKKTAASAPLAGGAEESSGESVIRTGVTNTRQVNLREDGSPHTPVLRRIKKDTELLVLSEKTDDNGTLWYCVEVEGETGYIRSDLVTLTNQ